MHKTRVSVIDGNKIMADGRWLRCIGNKTVLPGDWVWTDGKCAYGHASEGGGCYIPSPSFSGVPILRTWCQDGKNHPHYMYYAKGKMGSFGQGADHSRLLNRGSRMTFVDAGLLDAEYDAKGNLYTLEGAYISSGGDTGECVTEGGSCVKCNGNVIATYNLLPYAMSMLEEATAMAQAETDSVDGDDHGSDTRIESVYGTTLSGKVDGEGRFKVVAHFIVRVSHEEYAYYTEGSFWGGSNTYLFGNRAEAEVCRRIFLDGTSAEEWFGGYRIQWNTFDTGGAGAGDSRYRSDAWYAPDGSIRYPVHDGMYMTFTGTADFLTYPSDGGNYTASICNDRDELLLTVKASPLDRLGICPMGHGKFLVCTGYCLYLWENGSLTELAHGCDNMRIRRMPDLRKWKRMGGI